jgi:hypothetical protein
MKTKKAIASAPTTIARMNTTVGQRDREPEAVEGMVALVPGEQREERDSENDQRTDGHHADPERSNADAARRAGSLSRTRCTAVGGISPPHRT